MQKVRCRRQTMWKMCSKYAQQLITLRAGFVLPVAVYGGADVGESDAVGAPGAVAMRALAMLTLALMLDGIQHDNDT